MIFCRAGVSPALLRVVDSDAGSAIVWTLSALYALAEQGVAEAIGLNWGCQAFKCHAPIG